MNEVIENLKGFIDVGEWKTLSEIHFYLVNVKHIHIPKRTIRNIFAQYNLKNQKGEIETFIVHSCRGYQLTHDEELIRKSLQDDKKRALKLLKRFYETNKRLGERTQISLNINGEDTEIDLYDLLVVAYGS